MAKPRARPPGAGAAPAPDAAGAGGLSGAGVTAWLPLALVLAATIVLYLPVLGTQFFSDDYLFLDQVRGRSLWDAIRVPDPLSNYFRPVSRQLYFWAIAGLTHESPLAFRIGNLLTLLVAVVLLALLVRRLVGPRAAWIASGFFALHYAADVPMRWACGSQDLLAVAGALAAIYLHVAGRRRTAGLAMLLAAFSKEVVLLTPLIAALADHAPREPWSRTARRAWPLAAAVVIWAIVFMTMPHRHVAQGTGFDFDLTRSPLAALAHLFQVVPGIEWPPGRFGAPHELPPLLPTLAVVAAIAIAWRKPARPPRGAGVPEATVQERHALLVAGAWIVLAAAPVAAVVGLWSAYYYLFAVAGVALALGVVLARTPVWAACGALALLAWGSANARGLKEFGIGRDRWVPVSHINRSYIERSNQISARYLSTLRRAYPKLPPGSTVFFSGLPSNVAFQRGNGPLLRWAYRDSSLRSYFLNEFTSGTARSGPLFFFIGSGDSLAEMRGGDRLFLRIAHGMILSDHLPGARDALEIATRRMPGNLRALYWQSWVSWALGDTAAARRQLAAAGWGAGVRTTSDVPASERAAVLARFAAGDTSGAIQQAIASIQTHALDAGAHGLLADLLLIRAPDDPSGAMEAFASKVLAPQDPYAWRRWATVQTSRERYIEALASFQMYFRLGGDAAAADTEARDWAANIRRQIPKESVAPVDIPLRP